MVEAFTNIPWYYLAAVDQYERNVRQSQQVIPKAEGLTGLYIPPKKLGWAFKSKYKRDEHPMSIQFFNGMGLDGDQRRKSLPF